MRIDEITESPIQKVLSTLEQNCGPYLQEIDGIENALFHKPLLRGDDTHFPPGSVFERITVRQDRRPRTTPVVIHEQIDTWFKARSAYGIAYRSSSIFCTGSQGTADAYSRYYSSGVGHSVIVLPVGAYHYCWSIHVQDLYMDLRHYAETRGGFGGIDINEFLDNSDYEEDRRLAKAIASTNEIMLHCNEAILIHPGFLRGNSVRKALGLPLLPSLPIDLRGSNEN